MKVINLDKKYDLFQEYWTPKIVGELNGQQVKLAKLQGDFVWHDHEKEDEMFLVFSGTLFMDFRDKTVELNPGEMIIVPKGVEHRPRTKDGMEVQLMLIEPASTQHTGKVEHELTKKNHEWI